MKKLFVRVFGPLLIEKVPISKSLFLSKNAFRMTDSQKLSFVLANPPFSKLGRINSGKFPFQKYIDYIKKKLLKDDKLNIQLFYGGRFLNPTFTPKDVNYDGTDIYVFVSNAPPEFNLDDLGGKTINLNQSMKVSMTSFKVTQTNASNPDLEDDMKFNMNRMRRLSISFAAYKKLCSQGEENNVDEDVMFILYNKLNQNLELALNFFNEEAKFYTDP